MNSVDIIAKKRDGGELSTEAIRQFIAGVCDGSVPDYQAAAWLMAVFLRGMTPRETLDLTLAMRDSGERIDLSHLPGGPALDKHSTGGVGDKTSLIVTPILAAAGVPILKMSGRGLGYSGGTVDKLESIPGFRTDLSNQEAVQIVRRVGAVMIGQSSRLAPADKLLYALRDVTATVECIPLIASSIMSKKLAAGGERIVLDVKCGAGAFMKTFDQATQLAEQLVAIGNTAGIPTIAVLSNMQEPLGYAVGNALEVREAIDVLQGGSAATDALFLDLCLELCAHGLVAVGRTATMEGGRAEAKGLLENGAAASKFEQMVHAQGGPDSIDSIRAALPEAADAILVTAEHAGLVTDLDAGAIGKLALEMGAGRSKKDDRIDSAAGLYLHKKMGDSVEPGDSLATLHLSHERSKCTAEFESKLRAAYRIDHSANASIHPNTTLILASIR